MFVDDVGVELARREGLIDKLSIADIPNMRRVMSRFIAFDCYGVAFAMSAAGPAYNIRTGKPVETYAELSDPKHRQGFLMASPKNTQSVYLLIAATTLMTGKPYAEPQYLIQQAWPKMQALKPNVLSMFDGETPAALVAQGQVAVAGLFYSKSVNPYTAAGAPVASTA